MFRHIVLFTWTPDATPEQIDAVFEGLAGLPAAIPEIRRYVVGRDAGIAEGNYDAAVVADFDDEAGYRTYAVDGVHTDLIASTIRPIIATRVAVQHRWDPQDETGAPA